MVNRYDIDYVANELAPLLHGRLVLHEDYAKALALIAEMRPYIKGAARLCEGGSDMQIKLCGLVARAEELLRG